MTEEDREFEAWLHGIVEQLMVAGCKTSEEVHTALRHLVECESKGQPGRTQA